MYTKIASVSVSIVVGTMLVLMSQNSPSKEKVPIEIPETKPKLPTNNAAELAEDLIVRLPPPPAERVTVSPPTVPTPLKKTNSDTRKMEVAPLKPINPRKKLISAENIRKPLMPLQTAMLKTSNSEQHSPKLQKKGASQNPVSHTLTLQETKDGRKLLRILEAGKGPVVTLSWPGRKAERERVYQSLAECYAMKTVVYVENSGLYRNENASGKKWSLNSDAMSTFIRRPSGGFSAKEKDIIGSIMSKHLLSSGIPVRIFPRSVDAALLGGLKRIIGKSYRSAETISAEYFLYSGGVGLKNVRRNGMIVDGRFALPRLRRCQ
jgi:hypothetical protein